MLKALHRIFKGKEIVLASSSARRRELLSMLGLKFKVDPADVPEAILPGTDPAEGTIEVARRKALSVASRHEKSAIIGADTVVVLDQEIFGKPGNDQAAVEMLEKLSGQTHDVFTGFAVIFLPEMHIINGVGRTAVTFKELEKEEIDDYVALGHCLDKSGAYGIQDLSGLFVRRIEGCFYNVVGFPLPLFYRTCRKFANRKKLT